MESMIVQVTFFMLKIANKNELEEGYKRAIDNQISPKANGDYCNIPYKRHN